MISKSKTVAALLAIFLGSFGAHRFYLRSYGWGILYFLFFWTLIPGLIGFVEGVRYLLMDESKFTAKYTEESASVNEAKPSETSSESERRSGNTSADFTMEVSIGSGGSGSVGSQLDEEEMCDQSSKAWVPPGDEVSINGYEIPGGMVYVGTGLSSVDGFHGVDACLIDPTLDVDASTSDPDGTRMSYWPSYSDIDSGCRATYLEWLANGRRDPDIDIGYVFLFFYGLERRVLFDAQHSSQARSEIPDILAEVEELLEVYGNESSFPGYATRFLNAVRAKYDPESLTEISHTSRGREIPLGKRVRIGRQIVDEEPLDPEVAFEWFEQSSNTYLRTPGQRCEDEFKLLFFTKYEERFGKGLLEDLDTAPLTVSYGSASRSLPDLGEIEIDGLPDISALSEPLEAMQELANECCDELDAYSRYVGRADDRDSLEALSFLPKSLLDHYQSESLTDCIQAIENELGESEMVETDLDLLLEHLPVDSSGDVRKRDLRRLANLLEKLEFGVEPDTRFSAPSRGWGDPAVIYQLPPGSSAETSAVSEGIRLIQKLAIKVVLANDEVAPEQTEYLAENLGSFLELGESDRMRLEAHRRWLILDSPTLHGVRQRAEDLPDEQKPRIAKFLTALACSDGNIDSDEIQELSKIYPVLGLDEEMVHTHIHELQTKPPEADDEPVTIQKPDSASKHYEIPESETAEEPQTSEIELDQDRVKRTLEESQEVSAFLADIFEDEEEEDAQQGSQPLEDQSPDPESGSTDSKVEPLDEDHRRFLTALSQKQQWDREEVEELAREQGLFPGAAMEVINDYAFELVETPVIEGVDEIMVNEEVSEEILE
ncbi:TerB N-terminal domain-containing protein (plasmid) [Natrinema zhouii]|uniref:TerB N-terminal domain-containing protein n=1 Tax=Natrinema zhouii TaxID=1710539 RepID=UPI001CFFBBCD|nr:TerB N-terminal domain-containing protein [Natrinema zhouii]UHQ99199.1 TerB N-terminal domain-containing protein [Natrinema zhouii]